MLCKVITTSTMALLHVPAHDLLGDQGHEDKSEQGRLLVTSHAGWRVEMAMWMRKV